MTNDPMPTCINCQVPVGDGDCMFCRNLRSRDLADAHDALAWAPVDAEWMNRRLGGDWRDDPHLRGLAVTADRVLAQHPLPRFVADRLLNECQPYECDNIARFRYAVVLGAITRGGVGDELARLDVLLCDDRVDLHELAQHVADLSMAEWAQTTAMLLPDAHDLPHWLDRDRR